MVDLIVDIFVQVDYPDSFYFEKTPELIVMGFFEKMITGF
jgi:hypothetical protein